MIYLFILLILLQNFEQMEMNYEIKKGHRSTPSFIFRIV